MSSKTCDNGPYSFNVVMYDVFRIAITAKTFVDNKYVN
jgi:hypothetical protein